MGKFRVTCLGCDKKRYHSAETGEDAITKSTGKHPNKKYVGETTTAVPCTSCGGVDFRAEPMED